MVLHFEGKYAQPSRSFSIDNGLHIPFQAGTWNVIIENKKHFSAYLNIKCGQNSTTSTENMPIDKFYFYLYERPKSWEVVRIVYCGLIEFSIFWWCVNTDNPSI